MRMKDGRETERESEREEERERKRENFINKLITWEEHLE